MEGRLILTSGGYLDGQRGEELDSLIESVSSGKRVLFVDNATTTGSNVKGVINIVGNFEKLGCNVDVITLTQSNLDCICNYDVVYITGGDCMPLIYMANNTDFNDVICKYLSNGGVVIGESAGSIIFCEDLEYYYNIKRGTKPKYDVILPTYKGVGLINECLYPHFDKDKNKEKILQYFENHKELIPHLFSDGEWIEINMLDRNKTTSVLTKKH